MKLYGAIDLHSTNNVTVVINEQDQVVYQKRLPNDLPLIAQQLSGYRDRSRDRGRVDLQLVLAGRWPDGQGTPCSSGQHCGDPTIRWTEVYRRSFRCPLAGPSAAAGGITEGYIYPKEERAVRDLLRKRGQMVRQRTANLLSIQNLITRNTGSSIRANRIKTLDAEQVDELLPNRTRPGGQSQPSHDRAPMDKSKSWRRPSRTGSSCDRSSAF